MPGSSRGAYGACSATCGSGTQTRTRGGSCAPYSESRSCNEGNCPQACGQWTQWAACPVTCGGGTRSRSREGGCTSFTESEACNTAACPAACTDWGQWTGCSTTCGAGTRSRSRQPTLRPMLVISEPAPWLLPRPRPPLPPRWRPTAAQARPVAAPGSSGPPALRVAGRSHACAPVGANANPSSSPRRVPSLPALRRSPPTPARPPTLALHPIPAHP